MSKVLIIIDNQRVIGRTVYARGNFTGYCYILSHSTDHVITNDIFTYFFKFTSIDNILKSSKVLCLNTVNKSYLVL